MLLMKSCVTVRLKRVTKSLSEECSVNERSSDSDIYECIDVDSKKSVICGGFFKSRDFYDGFM